MTPAQADLRDLIVCSLKLLASTEAAFEYQRQVPIADVSAELFCKWFDDAYIPDSEIFQGAFSQKELHALAAFSGVFEAASREIGKRLPPLEQLCALPVWQSVQKEARIALENLGVKATV